MNNFIEDNVVEDLVVSGEPEQSQSQRLMVYVPVATTDQKGVAKFNGSDFVVSDGEVKLAKVSIDNSEYVGTYIITLDSFDMDTMCWSTTEYKSSDKFLSEDGKYLVQCHIYSYDYTGQTNIVQASTLTILDCSEVDYFEVLLPCSTTEDNYTWYNSTLYSFSIDITADNEKISCNNATYLTDFAKFECTLTFIKIG